MDISIDNKTGIMIPVETSYNKILDIWKEKNCLVLDGSFHANGRASRSYFDKLSHDEIIWSIICADRYRFCGFLETIITTREIKFVTEEDRQILGFLRSGGHFDYKFDNKDKAKIYLLIEAHKELNFECGKQIDGSEICVISLEETFEACSPFAYLVSIYPDIEPIKDNNFTMKVSYEENLISIQFYPREDHSMIKNE